MPKISPEHYEQGRAIYDAGQSLRELMANGDALEARMEAEHNAVECGTGDRNVQHDEVSKRYRGAPESLIIGYADGLIADIRLLAARQRGQRA